MPQPNRQPILTEREPINKEANTPRKTIDPLPRLIPSTRKISKALCDCASVAELSLEEGFDLIQSPDALLLVRLDILEAQVGELRSSQNQARTEAENARRQLASMKARIDEHIARPDVARSSEEADVQSTLGELRAEMDFAKSQLLASVTKKDLEECKSEIGAKHAKLVTLCALLVSRQDEAQRSLTKVQGDVAETSGLIQESMEEAWVRFFVQRSKDNANAQLQLETLETQLRAVAGFIEGKIHKAEMNAELKGFGGELDEAKVCIWSPPHPQKAALDGDNERALQLQAFVNG